MTKRNKDSGLRCSGESTCQVTVRPFEPLLLFSQPPGQNFNHTLLGHMEDPQVAEPTGSDIIHYAQSLFYIKVVTAVKHRQRCVQCVFVFLSGFFHCSKDSQHFAGFHLNLRQKAATSSLDFSLTAAQRGTNTQTVCLSVFKLSDTKSKL